MATYTDNFYTVIRPGVRASAKAVVDHLRLDPGFRPSTVIDVGGGEGWWLREFEQYGVTGVLYELSDCAAVCAGPKHRVDLEHPTFVDADLAVCLEVAEHLDDPEPLVSQLCEHAPQVLFSAAVPGQSGAHHVSCKWQTEWVNMFNSHGHGLVGLPGWELWTDDRVEPWYRQNMMLFRRGEGLDNTGMDVVHPAIWAWKL